MAFPEDWLHIKNWEKFQYRSDKSLPWIRLDCGLLQDREFLRLTRSQQRDLICIWLLSRNQSHAGWIPNDSKTVSKLIQGCRNLDLEVFVNKGFLEKKCAPLYCTALNETILAPPTPPDGGNFIHFAPKPSGSNGNGWHPKPDWPPAPEKNGVRLDDSLTGKVIAVSRFGRWQKPQEMQ